MFNHDESIDNWMSFCLKPFYLSWQKEVMERYNYILQQEVNKTERLHVKAAKELLAICKEHGWTGYAKELEDIIKG
jgi:hypothetical protein